MKTKPLTRDRLDAVMYDTLKEFAERHGDGWKERLITGWQRAEFAGTLQQIRNAYGPTWLKLNSFDFDS